MKNVKKIKKLEKKQDILFNKMMCSIGGAIGGYVMISFGMNFLVHLIEWIISLPFYLNSNYIYIKMDKIAYNWGNTLYTIGLVISIICSINAFFLGLKYFKLSKLIKINKKEAF